MHLNVSRTWRDFTWLYVDSETRDVTERIILVTKQKKKKMLKQRKLRAKYGLTNVKAHTGVLCVLLHNISQLLWSAASPLRQFRQIFTKTTRENKILVLGYGRQRTCDVRARFVVMAADLIRTSRVGRSVSPGVVSRIGGVRRRYANRVTEIINKSPNRKCN